MAGIGTREELWTQEMQTQMGDGYDDEVEALFHPGAGQVVFPPRHNATLYHNW